MGFKDSTEKVVNIYMGSVTKKDFFFEGKWIRAKPLDISSTIFREARCYENCGACCRSFSLDWLPMEKRPYQMERRTFNLNGRSVVMYSDKQEQNMGYYCGHLNPKNGHCGVHKNRPLSCDFELLRFHQYEDHNRLGETLYGRVWNMKRIDNVRGGICTIEPPSEASLNDTIRKLMRLQTWCHHFGVKDNHIPDIVRWVQKGPTDEILRLKPRGK